MELYKYRNKLPQIGDACLLTDVGLETTLIFHDGIDLPLFASFHALKETEAALPFAVTTNATPVSRMRRARDSFSTARPGAPAVTGVTVLVIRPKN